MTEAEAAAEIARLLRRPRLGRLAAAEIAGTTTALTTNTTAVAAPDPLKAPIENMTTGVEGETETVFVTVEEDTGDDKRIKKMRDSRRRYDRYD